MKAIVKIIRNAVLLALAAMAIFVGVRIYDTERGPALQLWHTHVPEELDRDALDRADWATYLAAEDRVFADVESNVSNALPAEARTASDRYFADSPLHPARFARDWNRSFILEPAGEPKGAAVFLHGLTDSPYSMRTLARLYQDRGFVAIVIRLPGHGTVPAGLTEVEWEDWLAASRLAIREARRRVGPDKPLHLIGYSNGGALAVKCALDALDDDRQVGPLPRADQIILISPMIGITAFARFAGLAALPAFLPAFAKAAWLSIVPEINPFKYNSFPVNGARQAHRLTRVLQQQIAARAQRGSRGTLDGLPPILTFQSVEDFTVDTRALVSSLYSQLPANGSELVLFDLNRAAALSPLLRRDADLRVSLLLPPSPRRYRTVVLTNAGADTLQMSERVVEAGETAEASRPLDMTYPADIFSLSHVALPFPPSDPLYGFAPDDAEDFGIRLGTVASRGEIGVLLVSLDTLMRINSNPFFAYLSDRVAGTIPP
ncbi:MAG: alpha/beta hydrolase [Rhodospirillales bacterium]|nr:alpha/beta hydrolase [Rhodospirillales bacterium]